MRLDEGRPIGIHIVKIDCDFPNGDIARLAGTTALGPLINLIPGSLSPFGEEAPVLAEIHQTFSAQPNIVYSVWAVRETLTNVVLRIHKERKGSDQTNEITASQA
jgi:hypothetical protein